MELNKKQILLLIELFNDIEYNLTKEQLMLYGERISEKVKFLKQKINGDI